MRGMYNKLFTKILDSSIWLAPDPTRLVWITLIAAMDEDGNAMFACVDNLAARARVTVEQAEAAIKSFESPDPRSGDPENDGIRVQRFPGGWHVMNAHKYRAMVTKAIIREQTRIRVAKHRSSNAPVTQGNEKVTPSEAVSISESEAGKSKKARAPRSAPARRLPEDFLMTQEREKVAEKEGVTNITREFERFRDHWLAASGANARKADWDATWRNWCRRASDFKPRRSDDFVPERTWRPDPKDDVPQMEDPLAR